MPSSALHQRVAEFAEAGSRTLERGEDGVALLNRERDDGGVDVEGVCDPGGCFEAVGGGRRRAGWRRARARVFRSDGNAGEADHAAEHTESL